ncbi:MAG TPA: energy transducer TonB [Flavobacteriales bacterium]|nr:energy transducer TonB [Flavobacteriales bacterium]
MNHRSAIVLTVLLGFGPVMAQEPVAPLRSSSDAGQRVFDQRIARPVAADTTVHELGAIDRPPVYRGGEEAMLRSLAQAPSCTMRSPEEVCTSSTRVVLNFIVERDGSLSNAIAEEGACAPLAGYALCAVRTLGRFTPGSHQGRVVRVRMRVPVTYELR